MSTAVPGAVTRLLIEWGEGKEEALQALVPLVYGELRGLARRYLRREAPHSLQTAGLVHEGEPNRGHHPLQRETETWWCVNTFLPNRRLAAEIRSFATGQSPGLLALDFKRANIDNAIHDARKAITALVE